MSLMETTLQVPGPWTIDDLENLPDDGHRYEIIDGVLLSPSTRLIDLNMKKERYERAGIPSYWLVDPDELRLVAHELRDGRYVEAVDAGPGDAWTARAPFTVTVEPGRLLD